jgi:hypothetical protein
VIDRVIIKILAAQIGVARGCQDLEKGFLDHQHRNLERRTAEVETSIF